MSGIQKRHPRPASAQMQNRPTNVLHTISDGINTVVGAPARLVDKVNLGFAKATNVIANALPSFPAATLGHMALGFPHAHILHPPSGPFPIPPIPLPSLGPIMLGNCVQVLINGMPSARAGDIGLGPTCCGLPPFYEIFTGSSNVFIGGARAARVTDVTMHCTCVPAGGAARTAKMAQQATKMAKFMKVASAIFAGAQTAITIGGFTAQGLAAAGDAVESVRADDSAMADALALSAAMGAAQLANDAAAMAASLLMGKDICVAPVNPGMILNGSGNVLIGGFPMPSWMDICKGLLKLVKGLRSRMRRRQNDRNAEADNGRPARDTVCTPTNGCPISMINGEEILELTDFTLNGPLKFPWKRTYRSSHNRNFGLGHGWTFPGVEHLRLEQQEIVYYTEEGRNVFLPLLQAVGESGFQRREKMELVWEKQDLMRLKRKGEADKLFVPSKHREGYWEISEYVDAHFNRIRFQRDDQGRLETIENGFGRGVRFVYNHAGLVEHLVPEGAAYEGIEPAFVSYQYDHVGDMVAVLDRNGQGEKYAFENHVLVQRTLPSGFNFYFEWDRHDIYARCLRNWGDDGHYDYRFSWWPNRSQSVDSRQGVVTYDFDDHGLITHHRDAVGRSKYSFYNEWSEPTRIVGPGSLRESYTYDGRGNCTEYVNAGGQVFKMTYDGEDRAVSFTDPSGQTQLRAYDDKGSVSEITDPMGNVTRFSYSAQGLPQKIEYGNGGKVELGWSPTHDLLWKRDGSGRKVAYKTDRDGNVVEVVKPDGAKLKYEVDGHGRPLKLTEGSGRRHRFAYDAMGHVTAYTDPLGRTMHQEYHPLGMLTRVVRLNGTEVSFGYDTETNLTSIRNEKGETHRVQYDLEGNVIGQTGFDGLVRSFRRDDRGFIEEEQVGKSRRIRYRRDDLGRVLHKTGLKRNGESCSVSYSYDTAGRLVQAHNDERTIDFTYDAMGNLLEEAGDWGFVRHAYDGMGRRTTSQYGLDHLLEYQRGEQGFVESMRWNGEDLAEFVVDGMGREKKRRLANNLHIDLHFDEHDRWKQYRVTHQKKTNGDRLIVDRYYQYDNAGRLSQVQDSRVGLTVYRYDLNDRLDSVEGFLDEVLDYDPAGNLLATQPRKPLPEDAPDPAPGNRPGLIDQQALEYDDAGNVVARLHAGERVTLEYNAFNQLVRSQRGAVVTEYGYDALGRRIRKTTQGETTWFTWDGDQMVQERRDEAAPTTYIYEPGTHLPLARAEAEQTFYYHNDHRGAPREMTDSRGDIVWSAQYTAYGRVIGQDNDRHDNKLRLQGQYCDDETGLYYNRFRYYDPELGRYVGQDPIGLNGGLNAYAYTNDPLRESDPLGLASGPCRSNLNATTWQNFLQRTKGWFTSANSFNNKTNPMRDAAAGWSVYRDTNGGTVIPIMGRFNDLDAYGATHGFAGYNRLDTGDWTLQVNDAWIMGGVDAGKPFHMVSNPMDPETHVRRNRTTGLVEGPSVTNREMDMLNHFGYTWYPDTSHGGTGWMVPPGGSPPAGVSGPGQAIPFPSTPAVGTPPPGGTP